MFRYLLVLLVTSTLIAKQATVEELRESFVQAFNAHNAKELASLWAQDAMYTGPDGDQVYGREAIEQGYEDVFKENSNAKLHLKELESNYLAPNLVEDQAIAITPDDQTRFNAYLVKNGEKWELLSVVEVEDFKPISRYEELKPIEWLIGSFQDNSPDMNIDITGQWAKNKTYILRSFSASIPGRDAFEGTQIIGWDPVAKQIRSWTFDSDGGFADGMWTQVKDQWYINSNATLPDGKKATMTNIVKKLNDSSYSWKTTSVMIDGELQPDIDEVTLNKRKEADDVTVR